MEEIILIRYRVLIFFLNKIIILVSSSLEARWNPILCFGRDNLFFTIICMKMKALYYAWSVLKNEEKLGFYLSRLNYVLIFWS